jgi:hypothetical protein
MAVPLPGARRGCARPAAKEAKMAVVEMQHRAGTWAYVGAALRRAAIGLALAATVALTGLAGAAPLAAQAAGGRQAVDALLAAMARPPAGVPDASAAADQAPPAADPAAAPAPQPTRAQSLLDKLSFHAYLNQAYAISDHHQIFGIPTTGTTDYRTVGLQLRFAISPADTIVTQLLSFRFGQSPINQLYSDVELELGFYEHQFADTTAIKVGKLQLPLGIYNEIRDIGTLLPFYAPPSNMYLETYASRSLEGLMVSRSFAKGAAWSIDADLYGGGWRRPEENQTTGAVVNARVENAVGAEVWINTPLTGVRFGGGYAHYDGEGGLNQVNRLDPQWLYHGSFDATFDRYYFRTEIIESGLPDRVAPGVVTPKLTYRAYYGQTGYNFTPQLSLNLQADFSAYDVGIGAPGFTELSTDYAASVVYKFRPDLVAKVEGHRNRGTLIELEPSTTKTHTNYGIASLAVTF